MLAWLSLRRLPADRPGTAPGRIDLPGAALATTGAGALIHGLGEGQQRGFGDPRSYVPLAAALLTAAFVLAEQRVREPMLPLSLLGDRARRTALVVMLLTRRLQPRLGLRRTRLLGLAFVVAGQLWLSTLTPHSAYATHVLPGIVLPAVCMGLVFPTASLAITADVPSELRALAGSMFVTAQQLGSAVRLALLATIAAARTSATGALADGYALSYLVATGITVLTGALVAVL